MKTSSQLPPQVNYGFFSNRVEQRRLWSSSTSSRSSYHSSPSSTTTDTFVLTHRGLNSTEEESNVTPVENWSTTLAKFSSKLMPFPWNIWSPVKNRDPYRFELETTFDTRPTVFEKRIKSYKETNADGSIFYKRGNNPEKWEFRPTDDQRGNQTEKWFSDTTHCLCENDHSRFESTSEGQLYAMKVKKQSFHTTRSTNMKNSTRHRKKLNSNRNDFLDHIKSKPGNGSYRYRKKCTKSFPKEQIHGTSSTDLNDDFESYKHHSVGEKMEYSVGKYKMKVLRNVVKKDILGENTKYLRTPIGSDLSSTDPIYDLELEKNFNVMPSVLNNKKNNVSSIDLRVPHKPNLIPYFGGEMTSFPYNQPYVTNNDQTIVSEIPVKIEDANKERQSEPAKLTLNIEREKTQEKCLDEFIEYQKHFTATKKGYDPYLLESHDTQKRIQGKLLQMFNEFTGKAPKRDYNNQHESKKVTLSKDQRLEENDGVHNKITIECKTKQGKVLEKIRQGNLSRKNETSQIKDRKVCNTLNVKGKYLELKCQSPPGRSQTKYNTKHFAPNKELPECATRCEEKTENLEHIENNHHKQYYQQTPTCLQEQNLKILQYEQPTQSQQTHESYTQTSRELLMRKIDELIRPDDKKNDKGSGDVMNYEGTHTMQSKRTESIILENLHPNVAKVDEINNDNNGKCDDGEDDIFKSYCDVYYVNKARNFQRKKLSSLDNKKVRSNPRDDIFNEINCQTIYRNRARFYERDVSDFHIK